MYKRQLAAALPLVNVAVILPFLTLMTASECVRRNIVSSSSSSLATWCGDSHSNHPSQPDTFARPAMSVSRLEYCSISTKTRCPYLKRNFCPCLISCFLGCRNVLRTGKSWLPSAVVFYMPQTSSLLVDFTWRGCWRQRGSPTEHLALSDCPTTLDWTSLGGPSASTNGMVAPLSLIHI